MLPGLVPSSDPFSLPRMRDMCPKRTTTAHVGRPEFPDTRHRRFRATATRRDAGARVPARLARAPRVSHGEFVGMHVGGGEEARDRALALYPEATWRGPAQVRLHRAACLVVDGHIGEGAQYATDKLGQLDPATSRGPFRAGHRAACACCGSRERAERASGRGVPRGRRHALARWTRVGNIRQRASGS